MLPSPLLARNLTEAEVAALLQRMDDLESEVKSLRTQLDAVTSQQAEQAQSVAAVEQQVAAVQIDNKDAPNVSWKGAPKLEGEGGWSFKPRGRLQYDVGSVSAPDSIVDNGLGFASEVRRARLGVEGDIPGGFGYKFELDFAENSVEITDAVISYDDGPLGIAIGQQKTHQSLEELTSSLATSFMERAAFTDAFGFERRVGLSVDYQAGDLLFSGGVFTSNIDDLSSDEANAYSLDGRVVYMPKWGDTQLHLGGSILWRDLNDQAGGMRYRQRPFIHTTDTRFLDTGTFAVDEELSYGLEAALINGPFHAAGEVHWLEVGRPDLSDPGFFGGYAEIGYFFTGGDSRGYKGGKFDRVKPENPVGEGGFGALQANLRYDHLDLNDETIIGGKQNAYAASLIWTPIDYIRFMVNYAHIEYDDAAVPAASGADYSVDVVGARAQVDF